MNAADIRAQVATKLADLGDTPVDVAAALTKAGVHGRRRSALSCPIANYVAAAVPGTLRTAVAPSTVCVVIDDEGFETIIVGTSPAIASFVIQFDQYAFPELVEDGGGPMSRRQVRNGRKARERRYVSAVCRQIALYEASLRGPRPRPYFYADPAEFLRRGDTLDMFDGGEDR